MLAARSATLRAITNAAQARTAQRCLCTSQLPARNMPCSRSHPRSTSRSPSQVSAAIITHARLLHSSLSLAEERKPASPPKTSSSSPPSSSSASSPPASQTSGSGALADQKNAEQPKPKTIGERIKDTWGTLKYLFRFYCAGLKQIWANRTRVKEIQARIASGGEALTREEGQLLRTHRSDMLKLPLFVAILLILEEILPLVVIYAPGLLPSTCILPSQLAKIRHKDELRRAEAIKRLREREEVRGALAQVEGLVVRSKSGTSEESQAQSAGALLENLGSESLIDLARLFSLSTWGGAAMIQQRLSRHLEYLREDDRLMCDADAYHAVPQDAEGLAIACGERGLRVSEVPQSAMHSHLRAWLRRTTLHASPSSTFPTPAMALLPLTLYDASNIAAIRAELEVEEQKGLIPKTREVLDQVVQEETSRVAREERHNQEVQGQKEVEGKEAAEILRTTGSERPRAPHQ